MSDTERRGFTLWLTGLPGAGKSTLARGVARRLSAHGLPVEILDGDVVRETLSKGLGFTKEDRDTNIRRIGFVARLLARNGVATLVAAVSPYRAVRDEVRQAHEAPFVEVFVDCPVEETMRRDPKGLYARAQRGEVKAMTGVSDPYEPPASPEVHVRTAEVSVEAAVERILAGLRERGLVPVAAGVRS